MPSQRDKHRIAGQVSVGASPLAISLFKFTSFSIAVITAPFPPNNPSGTSSRKHR